MRLAAFRVGMLTRGKILIALDSEQNLAFNIKYTAVRRYLTRRFKKPQMNAD